MLAMPRLCFFRDKRCPIPRWMVSIDDRVHGTITDVGAAFRARVGAVTVDFPSRKAAEDFFKGAIA